MTQFKPVKLVYTAGPIRSKFGHYYHEKNIRAAEEVAVELWKLGFGVICPHSNTRNFDGAVSFEQFMAGDLEMLRRCDIVVMLEGWQASEGAKIEHQEAVNLCKPIYYWMFSADRELLKKELQNESNAT